MLTTPTADLPASSAHRKPQGAIPSPARYRSLDAWRGVACISVVIYHLRPLENQYPVDTLLYQVPYWGFLGVPVFFVISGYCIAATAAATVRRGGSTAEYFFRRVRRIYPPYLLIFAIAALFKTESVRTLFPGSLQKLAFGSIGATALTPSQWWGNATLTESWRYLAFGSPRQYLLEHSWTLCYEEQFYFLFGLFLIFAGARFYLATLLLSLPVLILQITAALTAAEFDGAFFDGRWLMFSAGVFVHWQLHRARWLPCAPPLFFVTAAVLPLTVHLIRLPLRIEFFASVAFCIVILACYRYDDRLSRSILIAPFRYCGRICFSLYLTHWFVAKFANGFTSKLPSLTTGQLVTKLVIGTLASVAVGSIYYYLIERHFLSRAQRAEVAAEPLPSVS